ncbi:MAG: beta-eliminating lyase-related protein [Desulfovibrionaceae bacterium]|nr:beta-eliminating lyase-related protein [Desulfovibrionaceae bacterium]
MNTLISFASDNTAGVHPRVLEALAHANHDMAPAYGADGYSEAFAETVQAVFGPSARPWIVANGTAANVLGLKSMLRSHEAVLCAGSAHINTDECGAPEAMIGCKLLTVPSVQGKIRAEDCLPFLEQRGDVHRSSPRVLSISQPTEWGTVYAPDELAALKAFCREHDLYLHMDGARLANAAAALNLPLKAISAEAGVDVLSFGGTKNGLMSGDAVIFFNETLGREFGYIRKQHLQLLSKMRFMSAQFLAYFKDDLWLENACLANRMTALLAEELKGMEHVHIEYPVQVNAIFARLCKNAVAKLQERFYFYVLDPSEGTHPTVKGPLVRLMTSFRSTEEEVRALTEAIGAC